MRFIEKCERELNGNIYVSVYRLARRMQNISRFSNAGRKLEENQQNK